MTSDLASYLRELAFAGAESEALTRLQLLDCAGALEADHDEVAVLQHLIAAELAEPFASRVRECLAETPAREIAALPSRPAVERFAERPDPIPAAQVAREEAQGTPWDGSERAPEIERGESVKRHAGWEVRATSAELAFWERA